jgi:tRNA G18 (ribose-2'-O)-methylase SpoU
MSLVDDPDMWCPAVGFFAIGIEHTKTEANIGSLWRAAHLFGAAFIFTIGRRYKSQASDTMKTWRTIPLFHFVDLAGLVAHMPYSCPLIGIELDKRAHPLPTFVHPERCVYLLGAEDHGLTRQAMDACHSLVQLPGAASMNVANAGAIVLYDRHAKSVRAA